MPRCITLSCLLAACTALPEPFAEPAQHVTVTYEPDPWFVAMVTGSAAAVDATPSQRLQVSVYAVKAPLDGDSLDASIAVIAASSGAPFRGASTLVQGLRLLTPPRAADWIAGTRAEPDSAHQVGATVAVLAPGLGARIGMGDLPLPEVIATFAGGTVQLALASPRDGTAADELVLLAVPALRVGNAIVLFAPRAANGRAGYAVVLEPGAALPDTAVADALARAEAIAIAADGRREAPTSLSLDRPLAVAKLAVGAHHRLGALLALALRLDLPRCTDLLLAADEPLLIAITDGLPALADPAPATGPAWPIERAMWTAVLPGLQRGEASPALRSCLRRQLGAITFDPAALQHLLETSTSAAQFATGLREENIAALDDADAGPRAQAHAWLSAHGGVVPGYEPLHERTLRRAALRRHGAASPVPQEAPR